MSKRTIIALVNRKGGVAKTTSAAYLASCLLQAGEKVTGLDADPEKSWIKWSKIEGFPYSVKEAERETLSAQVKKIEGHIVIDTPPNDEGIIYKAASIADEVIIPLSGTGLDINRLATTLSTIADVERMRQKPLASILLANWEKQEIISKDTLTALEKEKLPILDQKIRHLTCYKKFVIPEYLDEYKKVLRELEVLENA